MDIFKVAVLENQRSIYADVQDKWINGSKQISSTKLEVGLDVFSTISFDLLLIDGSFEFDYIFSCVKSLDENLERASPAVLVYGINANLDQMYLEHGVKGVLFDGFSSDDLIDAIASVDKKGFFFPESTTKNLVETILSRTVVRPTNVLKQLTVRELEVIRMICDGLANKEIANELEISSRTVEVHRKNISKKTQTKNTASVVVYAIRNGLYKL